MEKKKRLDELGHWPTATWFQQRLLEVRIKALRGNWEKEVTDDVGEISRTKTR
jgi:hypothetical protein